MATERGAYFRKNETKREDFTSRKPELGDADFVDLAAACERFLDAPRESAKPPAPREWHRPWQPKLATPLWLLLARCAVAEGIESGLVKRASTSTDGWEMQVLDGDIHGKLALV